MAVATATATATASPKKVATQKSQFFRKWRLTVHGRVLGASPWAHIQKSLHFKGLSTSSYGSKRAPRSFLPKQGVEFLRIFTGGAALTQECIFRRQGIVVFPACQFVGKVTFCLPQGGAQNRRANCTPVRVHHHPPSHPPLRPRWRGGGWGAGGVVMMIDDDGHANHNDPENNHN